MSDLSQVSNEELMKAAGLSPGGAADLSKVPTADLIKAAGMGSDKLVGEPGTTQVRFAPANILPFREDETGFHFDPNAGILGSLWRGISGPMDALQGKFDPMSREGQARARETASLMLPPSAALRAGERAIPGDLMSMRRGAPPTAGELKTATSKGYDAARDSGAEYPGATVGSMADSAATSLQTEGILAELAPQTHAILGKLTNPPEGSVVTIASLDAARKALNRVAGNFGNPTEQEAARRVIQRIDGLIGSGGDGAAAAVPGGAVHPFPPAAPGQGGANGAGLGGGAPNPLEEAARLIREARGNAAAGFRSDRITGAEDAAELRAAASNSGQNIGNAIRQRLASILNSDKQSRGFSEEELAAIRQVVEGTATSNTLRRVSNLLGGGGGLGQTLVGVTGAVTGGTVGGWPGAVAGALPAITGAAARTGYNALVGRQVNKLDELIRQRSPLYQSQSLTADKGDLMRGLLLRGLLGSPVPTGLLGDYQP